MEADNATSAEVLAATAARLVLDNYTYPNASASFPAVSRVSAGPAARSAAGVYLSVAFKVVYALGILGNAAAILILRTGERRVKNRKHLLLLTSLAANDLVAMVGMMCAMVAGEAWPEVRGAWQFCAARVVLRVFGIGSVCIAVTMALERYLALTRPFLYQKQVTYYVIRTALLVSWFWAAALTCAPIFGLGRYYDPHGVPAGAPAGAPRGACVRYRDAETTTDFLYAVFYVAFGTVLCAVLVYCNLAVIRALYAISAGAPVVRRVSRSSCRARAPPAPAAPAAPAAHHNAATAEEVAFSRLMATLAVLFMICWLPQMVTSALFLGVGAARWLEPLSKLSDGLMLLNYVLDPVLYVLLRRRAAPALCRSLLRCCKRSHKTSTESMSMKTSCCQQDTCVLSDSSAAELRPLRAASHLQPAAATLLNIHH